LGAALATQPVIGTIVGTVLGGMLIGENDNYQRLFWAMGLFVIAMGLLSLFVMKDAPTLRPYRQDGFWKQFSTVFRGAKGFFTHRELMLVSITTALFFIPFNVYFVHMGNWLIYHLGFTPDKMGLIEGIGLIVAMALAIPAISLINRNKTPFIAAFAMIVDMIGLWVIYLFARPGMVDPTNVFSVSNLVLLLGVFLVGSGYVLIMQSMTMWVKQLYPEESRGQFEGVRVAFFTLIPMLIGTLIGNMIIKNGAGTFVNDYGIEENIPTEAIFFWAAIMLIAAFVPLYFAAQDYRRRVKVGAEAKEA
jgi:predicted MFS family arabinose efflux permease